jgi:hypothetical protein
MGKALSGFKGLIMAQFEERPPVDWTPAPARCLYGEEKDRTA